MNFIQERMTIKPSVISNSFFCSLIFLLLLIPRSSLCVSFISVFQAVDRNLFILGFPLWAPACARTQRTTLEKRHACACYGRTFSVRAHGNESASVRARSLPEVHGLVGAHPFVPKIESLPLFSHWVWLFIKVNKPTMLSWDCLDFPCLNIARASGFFPSAFDHLSKFEPSP